MASRGKGARIKGASWERELADILTKATNITFKRGLGQARNGGHEISDVYSPDATWLHVEAKRQKNCSIKGAVDQAMADTETNGKMPIVITKDDRRPALVTMFLDDWLQLFKVYLKHK